MYVDIRQGVFFLYLLSVFLSPAPESEFFLDFTLTRIRRCNSQRRYNHCHKAIQHGLKFFFLFFSLIFGSAKRFQFCKLVIQNCACICVSKLGTKISQFNFSPYIFFFSKHIQSCGLARFMYRNSLLLGLRFALFLTTNPHFIATSAFFLGT